MQVLIDRLQRLEKAVDPKNLFVQVMKNERLKELIIILNAGRQDNPRLSPKESQLWHGIDANGRELKLIGGDYSELTIEATQEENGFSGKRERGLPFDRITLYNDGIFYNSWKVDTVARTGGVDITINADPNRGGSNLFDDWGSDIVGLTDENTDIFAQEFLQLALLFIRGQITNP